MSKVVRGLNLVASIDGWKELVLRVLAKCQRSVPLFSRDSTWAMGTRANPKSWPRSTAM